MDSYLPTPAPKRAITGGTWGMAVSSPEGREGGGFLIDKIIVRRYIDTYFSKTNPMTCIFLHKPSVLAAWSKDELDPFLLRALCASGLMLMDNSYGQPSDREIVVTTARTWIHEVQSVLLSSHAGRFPLVQVHALVLVILFHFHVGEVAQAWDLVALAARRAFALQLNHERPELEPAARESRRRLVWAIYLLDRLFSGGIEDLAICPSERMHIKLPCDDTSFQRGIPSRAEYLESIPGSVDDAHRSDDPYGKDVLAYYIRLSASRDNILRYTKGVRRSGASPVATKGRLEALQRELQTLQDRLPEDLRLSPSQLLLKTHSPDRDGYILLHTLWFQCHCDLYRFLIPGIRESVSEAAMCATPPELIDTYQRACLSNAIQLCDLWSTTHANLRNLGEETVDDLFLPVSIYQVAQILHHLHHLLPPFPDRHSLDRLGVQLGDALEMAWSMPNLPAHVVSCLRDVERVLGVLGRDEDRNGSRDRATGPQVTRTMGAGSCTSKDDNDGQQAAYGMDHLPSRHSLIPCASRVSGTLEDDGGYVSTWGDNNASIRGPTVDLVPPNSPSIAHIAHAATHRTVLPSFQSLGMGSDAPTSHGIPGPSSPPPPFPHNINPVTHQSTPAGHVGTQAPDSLWNPFDMELNGYYDVGLDQLFVSLAGIT
ncbi:uncharacterized protein PFLUO_LOCUS8277 [Penicillium psychrofluorescens]|uniref:uncharacterized protein n=1 Tax=Penicillium psychrofluorescens TaxID=3158075 RepID=UPI003CCDEEC7